MCLFWKTTLRIVLSTKNLDAGTISPRSSALIKERATFVADLWDLGSFLLCQAPVDTYDPKAAKKELERRDFGPHGGMKWLWLFENIDRFILPKMYRIRRSKHGSRSKEIGFGKVMQPLRLSLVGALKGPHLSDIASLIGRGETVIQNSFSERKNLG